MTSVPCPCRSGLAYDECCGPLHAGAAPAPTAERLMRSRFSAFALGDAEYLTATWHPSTRPDALDLDDGLRWYRLDIVARVRGGLGDDTGIVEFVADHKGSAVGSLHERSRFVREHDRWWYVDGVTF